MIVFLFHYKYLQELIKRRSKVQEKNMSCERPLTFDQLKSFPKTISQWEFDYGLFTILPRIIVARDFSPSSFKLKSGILPLITKYVSEFESYLSYHGTINGHINLKCL